MKRSILIRTRCVCTGLCLTFSQRRLALGDTGRVWSVDDLLVGTTIDSGLRD